MKSEDPAKVDKSKVVTEISKLEIARILGVPKNSITKRAQKEAWNFIETQGNGGLRKIFPIRTFRKTLSGE